MNNLRTISRIIEPQTAIEGAGVRLLRSIAPRVSNEFDPFLLFDHFAFNDPLEGPLRGFPYHPHRGRMISKAYGEDNPRVPNDTEENRRMNRRIEFKRIR